MNHPRVPAAFLGAFFAACMAVLLPVAAAAQPADEPLPPAEQLFERHIEAIGGREAVDRLTNRRITGTYRGAPFEFAARLSVWWERDGRFHQFVGEPGGVRYNLHANGTTTWAQVMDQDPVPVVGAQRIELLDTTDFLGEANYKSRYKEIETVGSGSADGAPIWIVRAVTNVGRPHALFFDKQTGLAVGTKVPTTGEGGKIREMVVKLVDYKDFGGVLYPTKIIQQFTGSEDRNVYEYATIEVNVDDGHDYTIPESIKTYFESADRAATEGQSGG